MTSADPRTAAVGTLLLGLAALLPFFGSPYLLTIGVTIAMYTVLATS